MITLVAAPARQFKTWSMWLGIALGSVDALLLLVQTFGDLHLVSTPTVLAVNAVLGFLIVPAKLILQTIPVTTAEKIDLVATAAAMPMKDDQPNIAVHVNGAPIPATPTPATPPEEPSP